MRISGNRVSPIEKRVNWFTSGDTGSNRTTQFLLQDNKDIADGVYLCCGYAAFDANGTVSLPALNYELDIKPYRDLGMGYMPTFGGDSMSLATWENREAIAESILAWVLKCETPSPTMLASTPLPSHPAPSPWLFSFAWLITLPQTTSLASTMIGRATATTAWMRTSSTTFGVWSPQNCTLMIGLLAPAWKQHLPTSLIHGRHALQTMIRPGIRTCSTGTIHWRCLTSMLSPTWPHTR